MSTKENKTSLPPHSCTGCGIDVTEDDDYQRLESTDEQGRRIVVHLYACSDRFVTTVERFKS